MKNFFFKIIAVAQLFFVSACSKSNFVHHGYTFNNISNIERTISSFAENKSSKKDVTEALGSPTFIDHAPDNKNKTEFFFVEDIFLRKPLIGDVKVKTRVLNLSFDSHDRVEGVRFYDKESQDFFDSSVGTEMEGNKLGFFEQIRRNITNK